jgi:glucokinase
MLASRRRSVLAIDLGGTKIIAAAVLSTGEIISRKYSLTLADEGPRPVINRLSSAVAETMAQARLKTSDIAGIGIAAAGIIDTKEGIVTTSPNLSGWRDVPLRDIIAERLGLTTYLINDASAAALGEHRFGAGRGVDNLIYLTVSTGIGGGIIIDGELYLGADGCAGEIGHMIIETHGPQCNCGKFGCLEALASGSAMTRESVRRLNQGEKSSIIELVDGRLEGITAETVSLAARQGDSLACDIVARAANYLGIGLANLVNIFNPELIVIGGGVSKMGNMLLAPARKAVRELAFKLPARTARIVRARLGSNAGIIGAAVYAFEQQPKEGRKA